MKKIIKERVQNLSIGISQQKIFFVAGNISPFISYIAPFLKKVKMKKLALCFLLFILTPVLSQEQEYLSWEAYDVDNFFKKVDLESGTLDETGDEIDYIFKKALPKEGVYSVEISDDVGELYHVNGINLYIKFSAIYGIAGLGEEGILVVGSTGYYSKFYKKPD